MSGSSPLWRLQSVCLGERSRPRLDKLSLAVPAGITAVIGPSGAGKSSLLNLLVGFEQPSGGKILAGIDGDGSRLPLYWVPQDLGLWHHLTAREHLITVAGDGVDHQLLVELGLGGKEDRHPGDLSRGECSRLAVARALVSGAAVLVMDEPLAHIDLAGQRGCLDLMLSHVAASRASLVLATHSPEHVVGIADSVICLDSAQALYTGPVDTLYRFPASRRLAECLGPCNWFEPEETGLWLGYSQAEPCCVRPEQIVVEPDGRFLVRSARFRGAFAEAELEDESSGKRRRLVHRPAADSPRPGDRVGLRLLIVLLLVLGLTACGAERVPELPVRQFEIWQMPPDGRKVPAPRSLCVTADDEVVVLDTSGRVLVLGGNGQLLRSWSMPEVEAGRPEGVCVLSDGRIVVCDTHYHRLVIFSPDGKIVDTFGSYGTAPGEMIYPVGVTVDPNGDLFVCEYGANDRVQKLTADGRPLLQLGSFGTGVGQLQRPSGLAWHAGRLYVADAINNRIEVFDGSFGEHLGTVGLPGGQIDLYLPYDIVIGSDAVLWVVEYGAGRISKISIDGRLLGRFGRTGAGVGELATPWGITIDRQGGLLIADTGNRRIVEIGL
jgi:ABC-type multidrug transport system ATPase subunit/DNA-binding beta-propeller fold protein YncE